MMGRLQLSFLGPFQVWLEGNPVASFESIKVRALLAYLAVEYERPHSREALCGVLWPDWPERAALSNLRGALSDLRKAIGDRQADPPFLLISREAIQFNVESDHRLDVAEFARLADGGVAGQLEKAVSLYKGGFLEGFSVRDADPFEDWARLKGEQFHRTYLETLHCLAEALEHCGEVSHALVFARRQVEVEPLDESAHRLVMRLLTLSGRRSEALAQYEVCRGVLKNELRVEPSVETTRLYEQILAGEVEAEEPAIRITTLHKPPAILETIQERERPVFVAREQELGQLGSLLDGVLRAKGCMAFVTGSAGRGKTALLREFARQASAEHPDLLVAAGSCNPYSGVGDPYLPLSCALRILMGNLELAGSTGMIDRAQARSLSRAMPQALGALLSSGKCLVDTFLPGSELLTQAETLGTVPPELRRFIEQATNRPYDLAQQHLFEQYCAVLRTLSREHPLLILLDDLQWADSASAGLLYHLSARLEGSRILVLCAYRPEEIALGRDGERHPLEKALAEFKVLYGEAWLDLSCSDERKGRNFIDVFLDNEPNRLGPAFREQLFQHTEGHALFTVELLRAMQERGDLVKDTDGCWVVRPVLDWESLPARVEAVIAERIGRLEKALRQALTVASVEGEDFTAEVVARIREQDARQLVHRLSEEVQKEHHLVRAQGLKRVENGRLSLYRFQHNLFQQYLYNHIDDIERAGLHEDVGIVLEAFYGDRVDEIAPQLARHFEEAGIPEKAAPYLKRAGELAAVRYANPEAVQYFNRALTLTPIMDLASRFELLLAREKIYNLQGNRKAQASDLASLEILARNLDDTARKAEVALRQANYSLLISDYPASTAVAEQAIEFARQIGDKEREARGQSAFGYAFLLQGKYEPAFGHLTTALEIAQSLALYNLAGECNERLGFIKQFQGDFLSAKEYYRQASETFSRVGNLLGQGFTLNDLGNIDQALWNYSEAIDRYKQALKIFGEIGEQLSEGFVLNNLGVVFTYQGDYAQAQTYHESALAVFLRVNHPLGEAGSLNNLGEVFCYQEDYLRGKDFYSRALKIYQSSGNRPYQSYALTGLGDTSFGLGELEEAERFYRLAMDLDQELDQVTHSMEARAGLARVAMARGNLEEALLQVAEILSFLDEGHLLETQLSPFRIYLTCFQVLQACHDPKAGEVLASAHRLLQDSAAKISDPVIQRSFLENIPWNRGIIKASTHLGSP